MMLGNLHVAVTLPYTVDYVHGDARYLGRDTVADH